MLDERAEAEMALLMEIIRTIRNARAEYNVEPGRRIAAIIVAGESQPLLEAHRDMLITLARINEDTLTIAGRLEAKPSHALALVIGEIEVYLPLAGMVDLEAEQRRLQDELTKTASEIARVESLLGNERFMAKAPAEVVERERAKLARYQEQKDKLRARLLALQS